MKPLRVLFQFEKANIEYWPAMQKGHWHYVICRKSGERLKVGTFTGRQSVNPSFAWLAVSKSLAENAPREGSEWT